jgi:lipid-A-disaccharide synthase
VRIGLVAGETSGDLLGAGLIQELRELSPDIQFEGVAGPAMQTAGCVAWESSEALAVMGIIEPLREIPRLLRLRRELIDRWTKTPPDVFVGIDAPDFNLGLETRLRKQGICTAHYGSPSLWAWRQGRVRKIAKAVDMVLCLLPFEKAFYERHQVTAEFVGHPMADAIPDDLDAARFRSALGIEADRVVAVLPGSRMSEVTRLGPIFAAACAQLAAADSGLRFVAPMISDKIRRLFEAHLNSAGMESRFTLTDGDAESAIAAADVVLLASGTAALQAALLCRPMVAAYRLAALSGVIVKTFRLLKSPYVTLPNMLTQDPLVPEFLQGAATPGALAEAVSGLLNDAAKRAQIVEQFSKLRLELARGADKMAAQVIFDLARGRR